MGFFNGNMVWHDHVDVNKMLSARRPCFYVSKIAIRMEVSGQHLDYIHLSAFLNGGVQKFHKRFPEQSDGRNGDCGADNKRRNGVHILGRRGR